MLENNFTTVKGFFDNQRLKYEIRHQDSECVIINAGFDYNDECATNIVIMLYDNSVNVCGMLPTSVKAKMRNTVAEFLMRVNERLKLGNFVVDYDNGCVLYNTGDRIHETYTKGMFARTLVMALEMIRCMLDPLYKVVSEEWSPIEGTKEFFKETEKGVYSDETDKKD